MITPARVDVTVTMDHLSSNGSNVRAPPPFPPSSTHPTSLLGAIMAPVEADMEQLNKNLRSIGGGRHPMLTAAAEQIFGAGGKKLRPLIVFLIARATAKLAGMRWVQSCWSVCACLRAGADSCSPPRSDLNERHKRLAEITEMIHTASLVHDDVLDDCSIRRGAGSPLLPTTHTPHPCVFFAHTPAVHFTPGAQTVNSVFGTRIAVLAGDFLFAQSSWQLANLDNLEVIKLISQVIADFANGEISQAANLFDTDVTLQQYMDKSFYKTASLVAASCR